jgi:hypothetical protein
MSIREMSAAYKKFARDNLHLYEVMMSLHAPVHDAKSRQSLWAFIVEQVQRIAGSDRAALASVALWAFLHGATNSQPVVHLAIGPAYPVIDPPWLLAVEEPVWVMLAATVDFGV